MPTRTRRRPQQRDPAMDLERDWVGMLGRLLIALKIVLVVVVFDPAADDVFALPKEATSRAITVLLVAVLGVLTSRYGRRLWRWSPLYFPAGALGVLYLLAIPFALDRTLAVWGAPIRLLGAVTLLDALFTMVAAAVLVRSPAHLRVLAFAFFGAAAATLVYAVLQVTDHDPIPWRDKRVDSTLGNSSQLGGYYAVVFALASGLLTSRWSALSRVERAGLIATAIAVIWGLALTGSRAGAVAVGAAVVALAALGMLTRGRRAALFLAAVTAATLVATGVAFAVSPIGTRFNVLLTAGDPSREVTWSVALQLLAAHPFLGIGPDNYAAGDPALRPERSIAISGATTLESSPHDWLLQAAISGGPLAAVALAASAVMAILALYRMRAARPYASALIAAAVAFIVQGLVAPDQVAMQLMYWLAIGLTVAMSSFAADAPLDARAGAPRSSRAWSLSDALAGGALAVAAALGTSVWPAWSASRWAGSSIVYGGTGRADEAVASGRLAVSQDASRAVYWAALGQGQLLKGDARSALTSFERAASLAPYLSGHWRNIAATELSLADTDQRAVPRALDAGRRAIAAEPVDPFAHEILARALLAGGDRDGAIREARRALELWPAIAQAYEVIGVAYAQDQQWPQAEEAFRRGIDLDDNTALRLDLAQVLLITGRAAEAKDQLALVLTREPSNQRALALRATLPRELQ